MGSVCAQLDDHTQRPRKQYGLYGQERRSREGVVSVFRRYEASQQGEAP